MPGHWIADLEAKENAMGIRRALRSMESASRQQRIQEARIAREADRQFNRLERKVEESIERLMKQVAALEEKLQRDALRVFSPRYVVGQGVVCKPLEIKSEMLSFTIQVQADDEHDSKSPSSFHPPVMTAEDVTVRPLAVVLSPYATIVAFEIESDDPETRTKISWVRKQERANSAIYITDPESGEYYYPISSDLGGEVVAGRSKVGFVSFEPFRQPTSRIDIHFSPKALPGKESTLDIEYRTSGLADRIRSVLTQPSMTEKAESLVMDFRAKAAREIAEAREKAKPKASGCAVLIVFVLLAGIAIAVIRAFTS